MNTSDIRRRADRILGEYRAGRGNLLEHRKQLEVHKEEVAAWAEVQTIIQGLTQQIQQKAHRKIATVVTRCLALVFDDPYEFRIRFEAKRGRTEAHLLFVRNGREIDPMSAAGGGVVDVAAFALRLACLLLLKPRPRKILVLDEPFRFVSLGNRDRVRAMLEEITRELGVQIILVTHSAELTIGKIHTL